MLPCLLLLHIFQLELLSMAARSFISCSHLPLQEEMPAKNII